MKLVRAGALAGSLFVVPQYGVAEDDPVWVAQEPVWRAVKPEPWKSPADALPWAKTTQFDWERATDPSWLVPATSAAPPAPTTSELKPPKKLAEMQGARATPQASNSSWPLWSQPQDSIQLTGGQRPDRLGTFLPEPTLTSESESHGLGLASGPGLSSPALRVQTTEQPSGSAPQAELLPAPSARIMPPDAEPAAAKLLRPCDVCAQAASLGRPASPGQRFLGWFKRTQDDAAGDTATDNSAFTTAFQSGGPRVRASGEYLLWWANNDRVPVLATTGTPASGGILGQPGTTLLYGNGPVNLSSRFGGRFRAAMMLDECNNYGIDGSYLFLGQRQENFVYSSNTTPVISRPVFVLNNNMENAETVAFPGFSTGSLTISSNSQFYGFDTNFLKRLCCDPSRTIDLFVGYRFLSLSENVTVTEAITAGPGAPDPVGTRVLVQDRFATRNAFNGGQLGANVEQRFNRWFVNLRASVALGNTEQTTDIEGNQLRTRPGQGTQQFTGGLLAAQSNVGHYVNDRFSVVPDVSLNLGYQFAPNFRAFAGYSLMYWTGVVRPGQQIDRSVDLTYIPNSPPVPPSGQRRPAFLDQQSDFWAQGVNFGIEYLW